MGAGMGGIRAAWPNRGHQDPIRLSAPKASVNVRAANSVSAGASDVAPARIRIEFMGDVGQFLGSCCMLAHPPQSGGVGGKASLCP